MLIFTDKEEDSGENVREEHHVPGRDCLVHVLVVLSLSSVLEVSSQPIGGQGHAQESNSDPPPQEVIRGPRSRLSRLSRGEGVLVHEDGHADSDEDHRDDPALRVRRAPQNEADDEDRDGLAALCDDLGGVADVVDGLVRAEHREGLSGREDGELGRKVPGQAEGHGADAAGGVVALVEADDEDDNEGKEGVHQALDEKGERGELETLSGVVLVLFVPDRSAVFLE